MRALSCTALILNLLRDTSTSSNARKLEENRGRARNARGDCRTVESPAWNATAPPGCRGANANKAAKRSSFHTGGYEDRSDNGFVKTTSKSRLAGSKAQTRFLSSLKWLGDLDSNQD